MNSARHAKGYILRVEKEANASTLRASAMLFTKTGETDQTITSEACTVPTLLPCKMLVEQIIRGSKFKYTTENDVRIGKFIDDPESE